MLDLEYFSLPLFAFFFAHSKYRKYCAQLITWHNCFQVLFGKIFTPPIIIYRNETSLTIINIVGLVVIRVWAS